MLVSDLPQQDSPCPAPGEGPSSQALPQGLSTTDLICRGGSSPSGPSPSAATFSSRPVPHRPCPQASSSSGGSAPWASAQPTQSAHQLRAPPSGHTSSRPHPKASTLGPASSCGPPPHLQDPCPASSSSATPPGGDAHLQTTRESLIHRPIPHW